MHYVPNSIAARHAADRRRQADVAVQAAAHHDRDVATREALRRGLLQLRIRVFEKFERDDPTMFVRLGVETSHHDELLLNALLQDLGWIPDCLVLSRDCDRYERRQLVNHDTGTKLTLTISRPSALLSHWEAA